MPTGTVATSAREYHSQQTHYLRKRILGAAGNALYTLGTIPAGANILQITTAVRVVFSGGTPTISFGPSGTPAGYFALTGAPATTLGRNAVTLIATASLFPDVDTVITATVAGTPTAGTLDVEVLYTVDNDQ
jgi:hypothetical protein